MGGRAIKKLIASSCEKAITSSCEKVIASLCEKAITSTCEKAIASLHEKAMTSVDHVRVDDHLTEKINSQLSHGLVIASVDPGLQSNF